jgi:hypothetical protein
MPPRRYPSRAPVIAQLDSFSSGEEDDDESIHEQEEQLDAQDEVCVNGKDKVPNQDEIQNLNNLTERNIASLKKDLLDLALQVSVSENIEEVNGIQDQMDFIRRKIDIMQSVWQAEKPKSMEMEPLKMNKVREDKPISSSYKFPTDLPPYTVGDDLALFIDDLETILFINRVPASYKMNCLLKCYTDKYERQDFISALKSLDEISQSDWDVVKACFLTHNVEFDMSNKQQLQIKYANIRMEKDETFSTYVNRFSIICKSLNYDMDSDSVIYHLTSRTTVDIAEAFDNAITAALISNKGKAFCLSFKETSDILKKNL